MTTDHDPQPAPSPAATGLPSDLPGPVKPASLRESNAILECALAECGKANAAYVAANDALRTRAKAAEAERDEVAAFGALCRDLLASLMADFRCDAALDAHYAALVAVMGTRPPEAVIEWHRRFAEVTAEHDAAEARLAAAEALTVEWEANVRERAPDDLYGFGMARCRRDLMRALEAARPVALEGEGR